MVIKLNERVDVFGQDRTKKLKPLYLLFTLIFLAAAYGIYEWRDNDSVIPIEITPQDLFAGNVPDDLKILSCSVNCPTLPTEYECEHLRVLTEGQILAMKQDNCQVSIQVQSTTGTYTIKDVNSPD